MNYEIVELAEKKVVGKCIKTANTDPNMKEDISKLWQDFFQNNVPADIINKTTGNVFALYSDYDSDGYYVATAGCEVSSFDGEVLAQKTIPASKYAKFIGRGLPCSIAAEMWEKIWQVDLDRTFTGDFEDYTKSYENGEYDVEIYVAIK